MFSSIFSTSPPVDPNAPTFHPVTNKLKPEELFGELEPKDTEWVCASGFVTETHTWYTLADDGTSLMCQIIHSALGVWFPTIQFTCRLFNAKKGINVWKSINVSNFVTPPPGLDKRSSKADEYTITHKTNPGSEFPESYEIKANLGQDLQIAIELSRPAAIPGWKVGKGPKGGFSYFGPDADNAEGYVVHQFWPHFVASGGITYNGEPSPIEGPGVFIHAIQGMRPNLVASGWNFAHFQSKLHGGVSAIQMEFTTCTTHGRKGTGSGGVVVNVGSVVVAGKLASVVAETRWADEEYSEDAPAKSRALFLNTTRDPDTGYKWPTEIEFRWAGPSVVADAPGQVDAKVLADLGNLEDPKGLIVKVDILAEIPYVIKMAVNYVAGTKPYMYQYKNPGTLRLTGPDALIPGLSQGLDVPGIIYNEVTFISP